VLEEASGAIPIHPRRRDGAAVYLLDIAQEEEIDQFVLDAIVVVVVVGEEELVVG
jgi:hypothetical protein